MKSGVAAPSQLIWKTIDWFYPPTCVGCGIEGENICPECLQTLEPIRTPFCPVCGKPLRRESACALCADDHFNFTAARAAFVYGGVIANAIRKLKYAQNLGLAELFAGALFPVYQKMDWNIDLVTAVPLFVSRLAARGFNQSEWIAKPLAKRIGRPFFSGALQKMINTRPQVELDQQERGLNLQEAFRAEPAYVNKKKVLVIDDVMTTGATFNESARALRMAGASDIYCLSVASTVI